MTDELPSDPDVGDGPPGRAGRALHLRPSALLLVLAGGTVGTAVREGLSLALPTSGGIPWTILAINVVGAFLLGLLIEALARRGPDEGPRRTLRLLLGTGALGGFTTYSAFAVDAALLLRGGEIGPAVLYVGLTLVVGALASAGGIAVGAARSRTGAA